MYADNVHPTDKGHEHYARTLCRHLDSSLNRSSSTKFLPPPMSSRPLTAADVISVSRLLDIPGYWSVRPKVRSSGWDCFDALLESNQPGARIDISFVGSMIGVWYQLGPDSGNFDFKIDDGPLEIVRPFDTHAKLFERPAIRILAKGLSDGTHKLTLIVDSTTDRESQGHWVRIGYLLVDMPVA
jgi:hypothetical protein